VWTARRRRGRRASRETPGGIIVARALRNHNVWLVLTYVGLILLMARTYA
jgi:hypothetical protein